MKLLNLWIWKNGIRGKRTGFNFKIVQVDDDVIELAIKTTNGIIEVIANFEFEFFKKVLTLSNLHIDGPSANSLGPTAIIKMIKDFGEINFVKLIIIFGGIRTSGTKAGRIPKKLEIRIN